jgi:hypothetical protein
MGWNKLIARKAKGKKKNKKKEEKKWWLKDNRKLKCRLELQFYFCDRRFGKGGSRSKQRNSGGGGGRGRSAGRRQIIYERAL